jgi:hypothetical protein
MIDYPFPASMTVLAALSLRYRLRSIMTVLMRLDRLAALFVVWLAFEFFVRRNLFRN